MGDNPKVSHFRAFGCKCFILKKGKLDKFESRCSDGIFLGYAIHSRAYRVPNLETNRIMETCEVTFDETQPCSSFPFECAGDEEIGARIFENEKDGDGDDDDDGGDAPVADHVRGTSTTTTTIKDGPSPTPTTTEAVRVEAAAEGEIVSRREAPRRVQVDHPPTTIIGDLHERTTWSRSRNTSHFAHSAFVASFEPKDIRHALFDEN